MFQKLNCNGIVEQEIKVGFSLGRFLGWVICQVSELRFYRGFLVAIAIKTTGFLEYLPSCQP